MNGLSHEDVSIFIIENYEHIREIIDNDKLGVRCNDVSALLGNTPRAKYRLYHEIISGQLDADRADYLLRDSHCCGTKYGEYDFPRFLQIFAAIEDSEDGTLSLCVDEKDLPVAESLLIARYHYNIQIPYHRTRSGYDFALKKFAHDYTDYRHIFEIENNKIKNIKFSEFELLDDGTVFEIVKKKYLEGDIWAKCLLRQDHLTPIVDTMSLSKEGVEKFKDVVSKLRSDKTLVEDRDFFVQEQKIEMIKRGVVPDEFIGDSTEPLITRPTGIRLLVSDGKRGSKEAVDISERSWIFAQLNDVHKIFRVYASPLTKKQILAYI